jgi:hypothetical protein
LLHDLCESLPVGDQQERKDQQENGVGNVANNATAHLLPLLEEADDEHADDDCRDQNSETLHVILPLSLDDEVIDEEEPDHEQDCPAECRQMCILWAHSTRCQWIDGSRYVTRTGRARKPRVTVVHDPFLIF